MITKIKYNISSSEISYIHVGEKIKGFIISDSLELVSFVNKYHFKIKYVGSTSNLLFAFDYGEMYIFRFINKQIKQSEYYLKVGSSVSLSFLANYSIENEIKGYARLYDIPGLVGGSIINNSSCFNECISDRLIFIKIVDKKGRIKFKNKDDYFFSYHQSNIKDICIIEAYFTIENDDKIKLLKEKNNFCKKRIETQPSKRNTLGSTFKRVEGINLPYVMEKLKIKEMHDAYVSVSSKHVNFLQITPYIYYKNVVRLIEAIKEILYNNISYKFDLEIEIVR